MAKITEKVKFSLIVMPCCGQQLCWVNPRMPNFCPECGKQVWISMNRQHILYSDEDAWLKYHSGGSNDIEIQVGDTLDGNI